ncbi:MAG: hypothetical protein VKM34_00285 [Cyanobacteriota bacterium]|nr:hypothetical protein [Cyanobacteriota bacterium]
MGRDLLLALGIPLLCLLLAVLVLDQWGERLPTWVQRLRHRRSWIWNSGVGLIIGLSFLRWLLQR